MTSIKINNYISGNYFDFEFFSGSVELFIGYSLLQLSLYAIVSSNSNKVSFGKVTLPDFYMAGTFVFSLSTFLLLNEDTFNSSIFLSSFNFMIVNDFFSFLMKEVICISTFIFFLSLKFNRSEASLSNSFEYTAFIMASSLGSMILCSSGELIVAYLALELQSISFYLMACSKKNSNYSIESGLKYFIIGSFSSAFFLLGSSFLYVSCGTVNFSELKILLSLLAQAQEAVDISLVSLGFLLIGLSLLIKLAIAPFHLWSIDVYESSPTPTTYFFAVVPKLGIFVLLTRLFYSSYLTTVFPNFINFCLFFSLASIMFGALGGVEQRRLKSLLAYSSVGHTGYILLSFSSGSPTSLYFMFSYIVFYMISSLCFWFVFMFLKQKTDLYGTKLNKELGDLVLLRKSNPALCVVMGLVLFSLAGIPPLIGFLIKFGVFFTAVQASAYLTAVTGILLSLISTFYYLRLIKVLFFENVAVGKLYYPVNSNKALLISSITILLLLLFAKPSLIYLLVVKACLTLV